MCISDNSLENYYRNRWREQRGYDPLDPYATPYPEGGEYENEWEEWEPDCPDDG